MISILQGIFKMKVLPMYLYVSLRFRLMMAQKNILQQTCLILLLQKICSGNFTSTDGL